MLYILVIVDVIVEMDVLAKFISSTIRKKKIKTNGVYKFINSAQNQKIYPETSHIYLNNEDWITALRKMRGAGE